MCNNELSVIFAMLAETQYTNPVGNCKMTATLTVMINRSNYEHEDESSADK